MPNVPIRRSQLISPFGVGALYVNSDGESLISGGLDHWFEKEDHSTGIEKDEFKIGDWRLERSLGVSHFRMPADFRRPGYGQGSGVSNSFITQPFLRFPSWYYCIICHALEHRPLTAQGRIQCSRCANQGKKQFMNQIPFVAICDGGHIQNFPWKEWVHRDSNPACNGSLTLKYTAFSTGGAPDTRVTCSCKNTRTLGGALGFDRDSGTGVLSHLVTRPGYAETGADNTNIPYLCQGQMPWLGSESPSECGRELLGAIRGASNVYFAHTRSSIYIPLTNNVKDKVDELFNKIDTEGMKDALKLVHQIVGEIPNRNNMAQVHGWKDLLENYADEDIQSAFSALLGIDDNNSDDDIGTELFIKQEYEVLQFNRKSNFLEIREMPIAEYEPFVGQYFEKITKVNRLRETRALVGFSRVYEENNMSIIDMKKMLRREPLSPSEDWLPAHVVFGEGIFFKFHESVVASWETNIGVTNRLDSLIQRYRDSMEQRHAKERDLSRRLILLHTFAHILINALVFESGYGSASLRERLYVSDNPELPMAGVLIYTTSGDSDGSMGGLVRMGNPGRIEDVIKSSIEGAQWCSSDPVCMEIGETTGQGPDSCNLSACHNCALIAETSCELFNKLLDRAAIVGNTPVSSNSPLPGFFKPNMGAIY